MNLFESNAEKKYCESCRETLLSVGEIWRIELKFPSTGGLGLLSKPQSFVLCKTCFLNNANLLEKSIIKHTRAS